jgi:hypothetical protein
MSNISPAQAQGDEVTIITSAPNPAMQPNVALRLYIDGDENTPETGLTVEYQSTDFQNTRSLQRKMLDPTIDTLKVEYLEGRTNRWIPASEASTIGLLRAVRVTLVPHPSPSAPPVLTVPMIFTTGFEVQNNNRNPGR